MSKLLDNTICHLSAADLEQINRSENCYSSDSAPIPSAERSWSGINYFTLWLGIMISIPVYMLASGLIAKGMNWWQAIFVVVLGHALVMIPAVLLGHFGTRYGGSFTMLSKLVFGPIGNIVPTMIRALLGCFWFGVQCWIGGQAVNTVLSGLLGSVWEGFAYGNALGFLLFFAGNLYIALKGANGIKVLQNFTAPILVFLSCAVVWWSLGVADYSLDTLFSVSQEFDTGASFWLLFFPALSAMIAFDGTLALNTSDFTRHAKSQGAQVWGQLTAAPLMTLFICLVGVIGTNGSYLAFGETIWNPVELIARFDSPLITVTFSVFIIIATITTNIAGNLVPPSMVFSSLMPKQFSYKRAVLAAGALALLTQPWAVLDNPDNYIFVVLGNLAAFLGPMAGIYIAVYWFSLKTQVDMVDLYKTNDGKYYYRNGVNGQAFGVLVGTTLVCLLSQFVPALRFIFDNSYVIGALMSFAITLLLQRDKS